MTHAPPLADLIRLSHAEKHALIIAPWTRVNEGLARVEELTARVAALEAKLGGPPKTPDNSSVPPSRGHKVLPQSVLPGHPRFSIWLRFQCPSCPNDGWEAIAGIL